MHTDTLWYALAEEAIDEIAWLVGFWARNGYGFGVESSFFGP